MRVRFTYSQEEIVDAAMRFLARSKAVRVARWKNIAWSAGLSGLLVFLFFRLVFQTPLYGALLGLFAVLVSLALGPSLLDRSRRKALAKYCKEKYGDENEFVCEVELTPDGVMVCAEDSRHLDQWTQVEDIVVTDDSIDIFAKRGGVVVRNRAFTSPEMRQEFVDVARRHFEMARRADRSENEEI